MPKRCRDCWLSRFPTAREDPKALATFNDPRLCDRRVQIIEADNNADDCKDYLSHVRALKRVRRGI